METLSAASARRIALAAQGFADPAPTGAVGSRQFRRVLDRVGLLQIDSVNVLTRSHYLPVLARLGPYPRAALDRYAWGPTGRGLFEYWGHEASLLPYQLQPLLRWRMARAAEHAWPQVAELGTKRHELVRQALELVRDQGPITASALEVPRPQRKAGAMWNWHDGKIALEWLFYTGQVTCAGRRNFERSYDLPERVLPEQVLGEPTPEPAEAIRQLLRISARALGVATEAELRDYFRLRVADTRPRLAELVEAGELIPVTVAGWGQPAYLWHAARRPRRVRARALLSPFDSLIWERDRTERLFGMRYRIEIYTPAARRQYGYYVLPFLLGEELVARVDLKADRQAGLLRVQAAHLEPGRDPAVVVPELVEQLVTLADWLELAGVVTSGAGDLAEPVAGLLRRVG